MSRDYWREYTGQTSTRTLAGQPAVPQTFKSWDDYRNGSAAPSYTDGIIGTFAEAISIGLRRPNDLDERLSRMATFGPESPERIMAMADMAILGFPGFGEKRYSYTGRDLIESIAKHSSGAMRDRALPDAIRSAARLSGEDMDSVNARLEQMGVLADAAHADQMVSGRTLSDLIGLNAFDQALPIMRQAALMGITTAQGTYDPENFQGDVEHMEGQWLSTPGGRLTETAGTLGLYILPTPKILGVKGIHGRANPGSPITNPNPFVAVDGARFMGRVQEEGPGPAVVNELADMGAAINPFEPGLHGVERAGRVVLAAMAVAGLVSGTKDIARVAGDIADHAPGSIGQSARRFHLEQAVKDILNSTPQPTKRSTQRLTEDMLLNSGQPVRRADTSPAGPAGPDMAYQFDLGDDVYRRMREIDLTLDVMPARQMIALNHLAEAPQEIKGPNVAEPVKMSVEEAAAQAEARLAESLGRSINEGMMHLDELKAETAHLPRLSQAYSARDRVELRAALIDAFGYDPNTADAVTALWEARAQAWSESTGKPKSAWYESRISSIGKDGDRAATTDHRLVTGGAIRYREDGEIVDGKVAPGWNQALHKYRRILVERDGVFRSIELENIVEGVPEAIRLKMAEDGIREMAGPFFQDGGELIAVHHTSAQGVEVALDLGGWPAPSIAVTPPELSPRFFGDIGVIFDSETINPVADKANWIFAGDGWTVWQPKAENIDGKMMLRNGDKIEPYTLETVTQYMREREGAGVDQGRTGVINHARVASEKRVTNLDEARALKSRMKGEEATEIANTNLSEELNELIDLHLGRGHGIWDDFRAFSEVIGRIMAGASPRSAMKAAGLEKNIKPHLLPKLKALAQKVADAPIEYLEAKPYRAVETQEARAYVVPEQTAPELIARMEEQGAKVYQYDPRVEGAKEKTMRQAATESAALFQREQTAKASIQFDREGRALIRAITNPDASTAIHEFAHILRRDAYNEGGISPEEKATLEAWAGVKNQRWDVDAEEKFARAFERYIRDGKAPTRPLKSVFKKLAEAMKRVYAELKGTAIDVEISDPVREIFDNLLGKRHEIEMDAETKAREEALKAEGDRREELLSLLPEDPRLEVFDEAFDQSLADEVAAVFGEGAEDPREPHEILRAAQDAAADEYYSRIAHEHSGRQMRRDAGGYFKNSGTGSVRWYRKPGDDWQSDNRPSQRISMVDLREMPDYILDELHTFYETAWYEPEYYVDHGGAKQNTGKKSYKGERPERPRKLGEIFDEGEFVPGPMYQAFLDWLDPDFDENALHQLDEPLYQLDDSTKNDLALLAAKQILADKSQEVVERMLVRDFKATKGEAATIYRRAYEALAMPDIDRVYRETADVNAVAKMLETDWPQIPKSRRRVAIKSTLDSLGDETRAQVEQAVDEAFMAKLDNKATPVAEAILSGDMDKVKELSEAQATNHSQRARILRRAREMVAMEVAPQAWESTPSLAKTTSAVMSHIPGISETMAARLARESLDAAGIDYAAAQREQTRSWVDDKLNQTVESVWGMMGKGHSMDEALDTVLGGQEFANREAVTKRLIEREAAPDIVETLKATSSFGAITAMLRDKYPQIPAIRHRDAVQWAMESAGLDAATVPRRKLDPVTKRRNVEMDEEGEISQRLYVGANEVIVPGQVVRDIEAWASKHPWAAGFYDEGRYLETVSNRSKDVEAYLVLHREQAVTDLMVEMERYRDELRTVYGDKVNDTQFRELVMDWAENAHQDENGVAQAIMDEHGQYSQSVRAKIAEDHPDLVDEIDRIASWHEVNYKSLLERQNDVRRAYGLGLIPERADYMAHIREESNILQRILELQSEGSAFQPAEAKRNSPFNRHALERKGQRSRRDALANFEDYIEIALRSIHLTDPAIRRRAVARIIAERDIDGKFGDVVTYMNNMANELTGQPVAGDKATEMLANGPGGRAVTMVTRWLATRAALNGLVGNLRTVLMQTAPLPQTMALAGFRNTMTGAYSRIMAAAGSIPDPVSQSAFLQRRYAYQGRLGLSKTDRVMNVVGLPMEFVEKAMAEVIWSSFHAQAVRQKLSNADAVAYADKMAQRSLAGRAIGEKPPIFKTLAGRTVFQFQLEVNNMVQLAKHDARWNELLGREATPRERMERAARYMVAAYVANSVYEGMFNDRPLPDPIDLAVDAYGIAASPSDRTLAQRGTGVVGRVIGEGISAAPGGSFAMGIVPKNRSLLGTGLNREELFGRTPATTFAGALPLTSVVQDSIEGDNMGDWAYNATIAIGLPFGGRQLNKTIQGAQLIEDGSRDRRGRLKFEIEGGVESARALLFGPNATNAAREYYDGRAN